MRLPQASPEDGGRGNYEHFTNWSIGCGEKHYGYVAGPCQWFVCHPSERSKPCLHWMTRGDLPCKKCASKKPVAQLGYFPLWRGTDWRPKFVILYQPEREHVAKLKRHQRVMVFRERDRGSTLTVRPAMESEPAFVTSLEHRKRDQDIAEVLLMLWDMPELTAWVRNVCEPTDDARPRRSEPVKDEPPTAASDNALSQDVEPVKSDGAPFSPWTRAAVDRYATPERSAAEANDLFAETQKRMMGRVKHAEGNGNGKPKPK